AISTSLDMGSWEEQVRQFFLHKQEDDDELFFVILPAIIPYLSEEKEPIHTSSLTGAKKNCIGAIDGSHIPITIAEDRAPPYRNRKGTLSHNVMVACDFDLNFTFVSCGWEGSALDARAHPKVAKFRNKPFPLFYSLEGLYEGSVATGELNFTSTAANLVPSSAPSSRILMNLLKLNLSHLIKNQGREKVAVGESASKVMLDQLLKVVEFKKIQTAETLEALKEKKRQEEQFSISKCQQRGFLNKMEHNVREIRLRRKIRLLRTSDASQHMM
ncbi:hypothetical protein U9M48_036265, partial [Paspalum notatum var. saurae]